MPTRTKTRASWKEPISPRLLAREEINALIAAGPVETQSGYACPLKCGFRSFAQRRDAMRHAQAACATNRFAKRVSCLVVFAARCGSTAPANSAQRGLLGLGSDEELIPIPSLLAACLGSILYTY